MKISALKSRIEFHKGPRDNGLAARVASWLRSYSSVFYNIEAFVEKFAGNEDRDFTIQEELALGDIVFSFDPRKENITPDDWSFIQGLKSSLFGSSERTSYPDRIVERAERVYAYLKTLSENLLQPIYVQAIKEGDDCKGIAQFINALAHTSILDADLLDAIKKAGRNHAELADIIPKLDKAGILNKEVVRSLIDSTHSFEHLSEAYITLAGAHCLTKNSMRVANKCQGALGEMVGTLVLLNQAAALDPEVGIYKFISEMDRPGVFGRDHMDQLLLIVKSLQKNDIYTKDAINVFCRDICAREEILEGLIKLKEKNIFNTEVVAILTGRQQYSQLADALIILQEGGLLQSNINRLQNSCYNHQLKEPLEKFKEAGLLRQECLDMIWGIDPRERAETVLLLGKAGLATKENLDALRPRLNNIGSLNGSFRIFQDTKELDQQNFERILRDEVKHNEYQLLRATRNALTSMTFVAAMGAEHAARKEMVVSDVLPAVKM